MRVVQVINSFGAHRGGAEILALNLHNELLARGNDAHLIGIEACDGDPSERSSSLGFGSVYDPRAPIRLAQKIRAMRPKVDLVHAHLFPTSGYVSALRASGVLGNACLFTEHNTWNKRRGTTHGRALDRAVYKQFDRVVAISQGTEQELLTTYPGLRGRTAVVPNGIRPLFASVTERTPSNLTQLVSIGRLTPQKNFDGAIRALATLQDRAFHYTILGEGQERERLEALAKSEGIADRVSMPGHVDDVRPYLEAADICLVPSRWEGFGLAAAEAMNAALPLVAANVPGLTEVTGPDGDCARLVDPENIPDLAVAVSELMCDREARREMGRRGYARSQRFLVGEMTTAYVDIYGEVVNGQ